MLRVRARMITLQPPELLKVVEEALARHRAFGDSAYILEQFRLCSEQRLKVIAAHLPSASRLLEVLGRADTDSWYRVTGNTAIRSAIQHTHVQVETGTEYGLPLSECESIFDGTADHLERGKSGTPFEGGPFQLPAIGGYSRSGWIWREDYPDNVFGRSFRYLVRQNWGGSLSSPNDDEIAMLRRAVQLLHMLLPLLTPSALSHVHIVGIFDQGGGWKRTASSSQIRVGGAIFLARTLLRSPWTVAEHLLHECLHHKLYDFRHGHTLLVTDSEEMDKVKVISPWNPEDLTEANRWDPHRAFAALHVYVQLCVLAQLADHREVELAEEYGPADGMIKHGAAFVRAWYLGEQLKEKCWKLLGPGGQKMLDWLLDILDVLEPIPPPSGADLHLILDLYTREARGLGSPSTFAERAPPPLLRALDHMARDEVASTRTALSAVGAGAALARFDEDIAQFADEELAVRFRDLREVIARNLLMATPDGYGFGAGSAESDDPNALVRQLVLEGSERLHVALNNLPSAVAASKRRAHKQCFHQSCVDEVGRLLALLAAAVPPEGRILEIGTGVGVGTAWITSGLVERADVEVVSVEVDQQLSDAARGWSWPPNVSFLAGDVMGLLETLGTFDLIFVDASPIKHGELQSAIDLLRRNGTVVIDDLHVGADNTGEQEALQARLRRSVFCHPELLSVELDWATGVILAVRARSHIVAP